MVAGPTMLHYSFWRVAKGVMDVTYLVTCTYVANVTTVVWYIVIMRTKCLKPNFNKLTRHNFLKLLVKIDISL